MFTIIWCQVHMLWLLLLSLLNWASIRLSGGIFIEYFSLSQVGYFVKLWINNCWHVPGARAKHLLRLLQLLTELAGQFSLFVFWTIFRTWWCETFLINLTISALEQPLVHCWREPLQAAAIGASSSTCLSSPTCSASSSSPGGKGICMNAEHRFWHMYGFTINSDQPTLIAQTDEERAVESVAFLEKSPQITEL